MTVIDMADRAFFPRAPYAPGTVLAHTRISGDFDDRVTVQREVGVRAGYATFDAALEAMRGVSAGNLPAVAVVERDGRFHGYALRDTLSPWINYGFGNHDLGAYHLPLARSNDGIKFTDAGLSAIVDGDQVVYGVQPNGTGV